MFSSVFVLFAGLCIYFAFFCPSFIRELRIDRLDTIAGVEGRQKAVTRVEKLYLGEQTMTTSFTLTSDPGVCIAVDNLELRSVQSDP